MAAGRALGKEIADYGLRLIYGGGTKGIMGAVASGTLSNGGQVTGIIPEILDRHGGDPPLPRPAQRVDCNA